MSRKTELATIYRALTEVEARLGLVGAREAAVEISLALQAAYRAYRKEVERLAQEMAGAG